MARFKEDMVHASENINKKLDLIWEDHQDQIQESEIGTYVDVDNLTIRDAGITTQDMVSPGGLSTWRNQPNAGRYFMESFGPGRTRLFRR